MRSPPIPRPFPPPSPPHVPPHTCPLTTPSPPPCPALPTGYLEDIFKYHHEKRNLIKIPTPQVPTWKGLDERDEEEDEMEVPGV